MPSSRSRLALLTVPFALVALAACGDDKGYGGANTAAAPTTASATTAAAGPGGYSPSPGGYSSSPGGSALALADNPLGKILVDGAGRTLYMNAKDTPKASTCTDSCAQNWPAVVSTGTPTLGTGLDAEDFSTIDRADGTKQVTFYGHPLYSFSGDQAAGDSNGQGLGSVWHVLGKDGNPIM